MLSAENHIFSSGVGLDLYTYWPPEKQQITLNIACAVQIQMFSTELENDTIADSSTLT